MNCSWKSLLEVQVEERWPRGIAYATYLDLQGLIHFCSVYASSRRWSTAESIQVNGREAAPPRAIPWPPGDVESGV